MAKLKIKEFEVDGDPASKSNRWKKWKRLLNDNFEWFEIEEPNKKLQAIRVYGGERIRELIETLPQPTGDDDAYKKTITKLDSYFLPKKNIDILVTRFRRMKQREDESVVEYCARLRKEAMECEFHNVEVEIKRHLQETILNRRLARKSMKEQYDLQKLLTEAQADEEARRHEREVSGAEKPQDYAVDKIFPRRNQRNPKRVNEHTEGKTQSNGKNKDEFSCNRCGRTHGIRECPAYGKTCRKCDKLNHFAIMCKNADETKKQPRQYEQVVKQLQDHDEFSSSDEEYVKNIAEGSESSGKVSAINTNKKTSVKLLMNGVKVKMSVDSGSSANILDEHRFGQIQQRSSKHIVLKKSKVRLFAFGSTRPIPVLGKFETVIERKDKLVAATFIVVKGKIDSELLLGCDTAMELGILKIEVNNIKKDGEPVNNGTQAILSKYDTLFHGIGKHKHVQVKIYSDESVTPVAMVNRRIPYHYQDKVKKQLEELEQAGVIEPVPENEPTTWISPLVIQPKKDPNEIRICVDMREPNKAMLRMKREFPTVEEVVQELNGATRFSKLDLNHGYHQLGLHPDSRHFTTFNTPWGLKRYTRLNFGTVIAQEVFHEEIKKTIAAVSGARNISDDIIIFGKTQDDHDQALEHTLQRIKDCGLTLNKKKCLFNQPKIEFFGYIFTANGLSPDPAKVQALKEADKPTNVAEMRSYIGMANYSARFIDRFSTLTAPLRELTKKGVTWKWTAREENAFQELKNALTEDCILMYFETNREIEVVVDASPVGLGAILTQKYKGLFRPVMYVSRSLTEVEQRYSQTEREALAIRWSCERLRMYLFGAGFKVITDHKPLTYIFNNLSSKLPIRLERWNMYLQEFNFSVEYRPGKTNPADYMSRHPVQYTSIDMKEERKTERMIGSITRKQVMSAMSWEEIRKATKEDQVLTKVIGFVQNDNRASNFKGELEPYKNIHLELSVVDGIIVRQQRIVMPKSLQKRSVELSHEGHQGIVKTKHFLRSIIWFPGMDTVVEREVRSCLPCQAAKPYERREPLMMTELPHKPWQKISVDFSGPYPTGEYCLLMMDDYSRYPVVEIVTSTSAKAVIPKVDKAFSLFGIVEECKTDNGPPFQGEEFREYATTSGFTHRKITPLHPRANGEIERFVQTMQVFIRTTVAEGGNWKETLPTFLRMYRATEHSVTGKSPYFLMFGREMNGKIPRLTEGFEEELEVRLRDAQKKQKMKEYADKKANARQCEIQGGDMVLVKQKKQNKLSTPFENIPYVVSRKKGSMVTAERTTDRREITRNSSHFKPLVRNLPEISGMDKMGDEEDRRKEGKDEESEVGQKKVMENETMEEVVESDKEDGLSVEIPTRRSSRERHTPGYLKDYQCVK